MLFYLAWKNVVSKKSSFVIVLFIAFAVMLLVVTNSVFDSTENGLRDTFVSSFTGDLVVRPKNKTPLSLFGDETPVTGKLTSIPTLSPYISISDYLGESDMVENFVPQLSGRAAMEIAGADGGTEHAVSYVFGVDAERYCSMMTSIELEEGGFWEPGGKGAMVSRPFADAYGLSLGSEISFVVAAGLSSRTRTVPVSAIYHYRIENPVMDKIVLVNPETVRSLFDISELSRSGSDAGEDEGDSLYDFDFDDLFSEAEDFSEAVTTEEVRVSQEEVDALNESFAESTSWNFIVCRLADPRRKNAAIIELNREFRRLGWAVEAVDWRSSAGNTAFYLFVLRLILNIGIVVVLLAGFIVINNTLVVNVLDRIREIGTMRAIGAGKRYISVECAAETFIMAVVAGAIGCALGVVCSRLVNAAGISIHNSFLVQLFGGRSLVTQIKATNILGALALSLFIGLVAWIYPVSTALGIRPVQAMQGGK